MKDQNSSQRWIRSWGIEMYWLLIFIIVIRVVLFLDHIVLVGRYCLTWRVACKADLGFPVPVSPLFDGQEVDWSGSPSDKKPGPLPLPTLQSFGSVSSYLQNLSSLSWVGSTDLSVWVNIISSLSTSPLGVQKTCSTFLQERFVCIHWLISKYPNLNRVFWRCSASLRLGTTGSYVRICLDEVIISQHFFLQENYLIRYSFVHKT